MIKTIKELELEDLKQDLVKYINTLEVYKDSKTITTLRDKINQGVDISNLHYDLDSIQDYNKSYTQMHKIEDNNPFELNYKLHATLHNLPKEVSKYEVLERGINYVTIRMEVRH